MLFDVQKLVKVGIRLLPFTEVCLGSFKVIHIFTSSPNSVKTILGRVMT